MAGIRRLERGLRLAARAAERTTGLSAAQLFVLENLAEAESSSIAELAARTHTDRSSVSVVVDRLEAAGLVKRSQSSDDHRRTETQITRRGRAVLAKASLSPTTALMRALDRLPAAKVRQLGAALALLDEELGYEKGVMLFEDD